MFNWLRNLLLVVVLIAIIVLSFWISFMIGKRMLAPVKKLPTNFLLTEESRSILPPEITLEVEGLTFETAPFETGKKTEKKASVAKPAINKARIKTAPAAVKTVRKPAPKTPAVIKVEAKAIALGKYTVQVGAFSRETNARALKNELSGKGFSAEVRKTGTLYRVFSGRYDDLSIAGAELKKLTASGYEGIIRRYE